MSSETTMQIDADAVARALRCSSPPDLAKLGFGGDWQVRFTFPCRNGASYQFDIPAEGPFWSALVVLAKSHLARD